MSYSLPPLRSLLQDVDTTEVDQNSAVRPRNGYSDFSRILNPGSEARYLETRLYV